MKIKFPCPHCAQRLAVLPGMDLSKLACPACDKPFCLNAELASKVGATIDIDLSEVTLSYNGQTVPGERLAEYLGIR